MQDALLHDPLPQHQRVAIFGLGSSGLAAAHLLSGFGKTIIASDTADESRMDEFRSKLPQGSRIILGKNAYEDATIIVTSPGLSPDTEILTKAQASAIPIIAELELASRTSKTPIVAITGTDGKTTTTTLVSHILKLCGIRNRTGGNIGIPFSHIVQDSPNLDCFVIETSAFQLPFCPTFKPRVLIATNIAEDHTEYFNHDWQKYVEAKRKPLAPMIASDTAVLNASDPEILRWRNKTQAKIFWYAMSEADIPNDALDFAYRNDEGLFFSFKGENFCCKRSSIPLSGVHNEMNVLSAICASLSVGADFNKIIEALATYTAPPHRIEKITTIEGIDFIDDSKATNPHSAIAALLAIDKPTVLIAGGVDKGLSLTEWIETMKKNVKALFLIGALRERLQREALENGLTLPIYQCKSLEEATEKAYEAAKLYQASCVLLSPACSSYDMFKNYEQRGEVFAHAALSLKKTAP